jgi:hypothetical protein
MILTLHGFRVKIYFRMVKPGNTDAAMSSHTSHASTATVHKVDTSEKPLRTLDVQPAYSILIASIRDPALPTGGESSYAL